MFALIISFTTVFAAEPPVSTDRPAVAAPLEGPLAGYEIGPGDQITINVHRADFGDVTEFVVSEGGEISFPYVGRVKLAGLTPFQAEEHMADVLREGWIRNPEVSVKVSNHAGHRVEVMGMVENPGIYPLSRATTLRSLITQAGGAQVGTRVVIARGDDRVVVASAELDGPAGERLLTGDDVITVEGSERVYFAGEVANEGSLPFRRGITVSQAFIEIGGPGDFPMLSKSYIVRNGDKIKINLRKVLKGKASDTPLLPGDRVIIPTNPF